MLIDTEWSLSAAQKPLRQLERKGYFTTYMGEASFGGFFIKLFSSATFFTNISILL